MHIGLEVKRGLLLHVGGRVTLERIENWGIAVLLTSIKKGRSIFGALRIQHSIFCLL